MSRILCVFVVLAVGACGSGQSEAIKFSLDGREVTEIVVNNMGEVIDRGRVLTGLT